jgi:5-methylcytosine-specific restriction endonuclease McrA
MVTALFTGGIRSPLAFVLAASLCSLMYLRLHRKTRAAGRQSVPNRPYTSHSIPQSLKFRVMRASDGVCGICTKPIRADDEMEVDHKIPWSHGGETVFDNLWCVHKECNRSKGNRFENE